MEMCKWNVAQCGKKDEIDISLLQENTKAELTTLKSKDFKSDLDKFYGRFGSVVRYLEAIGVNMDDGYLMRILASGCSEHRDLKTRTEHVYMESFDDYHELKIAYSSWLESRTIRPQKGLTIRRWRELPCAELQEIFPSVKRNITLRPNVTRSIQTWY